MLSVMFAAAFIVGGNLGVFAKIVYVVFSLLVIVAVFLPPESFRKKTKAQTAVNCLFTAVEVGALVYAGSPVIAAWSLFASILAVIVTQAKVTEHEKDLASSE